MLGSLLKAVVKTATLPISIAVDTASLLDDLVEERGIGNRTGKHINSIADDLDNVL